MQLHFILTLIFSLALFGCNSGEKKPNSTAKTPSKAEKATIDPKAETPIKAKELSIQNTKSVEFLGKKFELKFQDSNETVKIYEYFLAKETTEKWIEMVEFQVYSGLPDEMTPLIFAKNISDNFMKNFPHMKFAIYADKNSDAAILDFFFPTSTYKEEGKTFLEFNAYKIYRDPKSKQLINLHYAKNIESISNTRVMEIVSKEIKQIREESSQALSGFPIYSK